MPETVGEAESLYEQGKTGANESIVFLGSDGTLHQFEPLTNEEETEHLEQLL